MARTQATTGNGYIGTRTSPMPVTASPGQIVSAPAPNPRAFRGAYTSAMNKPQGYGAKGDNMPVAILPNGGYTYHYGLQSSAPGTLGTILADPTKTTYFTGNTTPTWGTSAGSDGVVGKGVSGKTLAARGTGVGTGAGGYGAGGSAYLNGVAAVNAGNNSGGAYDPSQNGQQLQHSQDVANADNESRYQEGKGIISTGQAGQANDLNAGYADLYGTAAQISNDDAIRAKRETNQEVARTTSQLYGMGLANNTGAIMARQGVLDRGSERETAANDTALKAKLGLQQNFVNTQQANDAANRRESTGWIYNKETQGPDLNAWASLLTRPGASGATGAAGFPGAAGGAYGGYGNASGGGTGFNLNQGGGSGNQSYAGYGPEQSVNNANYGLGGNLPQNQNQNQNPYLDPNYSDYWGNTDQSNAQSPFLPGEGDGTGTQQQYAGYGTDPSYADNAGNVDRGVGGASGATGAAGQPSDADMAGAVQAAYPGTDVSRMPAAWIRAQYQSLAAAGYV